MAKTIAYVQERGYSTEDDLITALTTSQSETANCRKNLRSTQQELKRINEQIHYTGQYLAGNFYTQKIKNNSDRNICQKSRFMKLHEIS